MKWNKNQIINLLEKASESNVDFELTDEQIAEFFTVKEQPHSDLGLLVKKKVTTAIENNYNKKAPYRIKVFEKQWPENKIEVYLFSNEGLLCGNNILNSIYVFKGNLFSIPPYSKEYQNVLKKGVKIFSFTELFSSLIGSRFESLQSDYEIVEMKQVNNLEEANITIPNFLKKWFKNNNKETSLNSTINCKAEIKLT